MIGTKLTWSPKGQSGQRDSLAFYGIVSALPARIRHMHPGALLTDPTGISNALGECVRLFGWNGIALDMPSMMWSQLGLSVEQDITGRERIVQTVSDIVRTTPTFFPAQAGMSLEALKRLKGLGQTQVLGLGYGPGYLLERLDNDVTDLSPELLRWLGTQIQWTVDWVKLQCEAGISALAVMEPLITQAFPQYMARLRPLFSIAKFFRIPTILLVQDIHDIPVANVLGLGATALALPSRLINEEVSRAAEQRRILLGTVLQSTDIAGDFTTLPDGATFAIYLDDDGMEVADLKQFFDRIRQ